MSGGIALVLFFFFLQNLYIYSIITFAHNENDTVV